MWVADTTVMHQSSSQLLCTYGKLQTHGEDIQELRKYYNVLDGRIYILQSGHNPDDVFLTYNADRLGTATHPRTTAVHRKKEYNVIYSINALNELIRQETGGKISKTHQINWWLYGNSLITARDGIVKITPTRLLKIFKI